MGFWDKAFEDMPATRNTVAPPQAPVRAPAPAPVYQAAPVYAQPQAAPQGVSGQASGVAQSLTELLTMPISQTGGGDAVKAGELDRCPQCGSNNYFNRHTAGAYGKSPAPSCFECGYNGQGWRQSTPQA